MMISWVQYKLDPTPTTMMLVPPRRRRSRRFGSTRRGR